MGSGDQDPTRGREPTGAARTYDVFLSYSHGDKTFAERLEKALTAYRPPLFTGLRPRRLKVFRDQSEADNIRLSDTIGAALRGARKLVVLCSPSSRDRPWVNEEVRRFSENNRCSNIALRESRSRTSFRATPLSNPNPACSRASTSGP
ncbi:MAG: toll/interleukin-1 receptor domain-containing protein [Hyphomicrobium sp.]|uniref:toll/interleukin-1 receptor domain-containing protein n=1 Tax=Hyphomicrobium sp. TaxID=82 RepID=UPI003D0E35C4